MTLKNAIVLGGSRGIGFAVARKFVEHGINVTLVSRNSKNLATSVQDLRNYASNNGLNVNIDSNVCNISQESDISNVCTDILNTYTKHKKSVDILVNSAGITYNRLLLSTSTENVTNVMQTNLIGTILFTKFISKQMIKQKSGSIINIGSIVGSRGNSGQTIYSASKAGLIGFTKSLAKEYGHKGISVNIISPGFIKTDMTTGTLSDDQMNNIRKNIPLQRIGSPEEVANVAYFLALNSFITGSVLSVDGGLSLTF